jgi:hypothetical protein
MTEQTTQHDTADTIAERSPCEWYYEDGEWLTSCHESFYFNDGGVEENRFRFCPHCGGPIKIIVEEEEQEIIIVILH